MSMSKIVPGADAIGMCAVVALCLLLGACESMPTLIPGRRQASSQSPTKLPPAQIQVELMSFTDSYTALLGQAADRMAESIPEQRQVILQAKIRNIRNAIIIAAGANPVGSLLDMTVMVTLQRQVTEEHWVPQIYGEAGEPFLTALTLLEREIWQLAARALDEEAVEALKELIPEIRARFPDQVLVSSIRASDFAEDRRAAVVQLEGGTSLLQLFQLDPLASLSPASQELAQTRLLAERFFFWIKRMPVMMNWQMEDMVMDTFSEPEVQSLVEATAQLSAASESLSVTAAELSEWVPEERAAAIDQTARALSDEVDTAIERAAERLAVERDAAITQALDGIATEREAILRTFENEEVRLRGLLEEMQRTAEVTTVLSTSLNETVLSTDRFIASFRRDPSDPPRPAPSPDRRPFDITDYQATAETVSVTAREIGRPTTRGSVPCSAGTSIGNSSRSPATRVQPSLRTTIGCSSPLVDMESARD